MSKPLLTLTFNATDCDELASDCIARGDFKGAKTALLARDYLRELGDTSTEPTPAPTGPFTAKDFEDVAAEWEQTGHTQIAALAREHAAVLRQELSDSRDRED